MTKSEQRSLVTKKATYGLTPTEISVLTALITINNVGKDLKTANAELPFTLRLAKVAHRTGHSEAVVGRCIHHMVELALITILPDSGRENRYRLHLAPMYDWKPSTEKTKKQIASATNAELARETKRQKQQAEDDAAAEDRRDYQRKFIQSAVQAGQESEDTKAFNQVIQDIKVSTERHHRKMEEAQIAQQTNTSAWQRMTKPAPPGTFVPDPVQQELPAKAPPHQEPIHAHVVQPEPEPPIQPEPTPWEIAENLRKVWRAQQQQMAQPPIKPPKLDSTDAPAPVRLYKPPYDK